MRIRINLEGYDELFNTFTRAEKLSSELIMAINDVTALIFMNSQMRVPVDTGRLKASGKIHPAKRDATGIEALITYNTYYAFWVEVRRDLHHNDPTQAGYLEDSVKEVIPVYRDTLVSILMQVFGKGGNLNVTYRSLTDSTRS